MPSHGRRKIIRWKSYSPKYYHYSLFIYLFYYTKPKQAIYNIIYNKMILIKFIAETLHNAFMR